MTHCRVSKMLESAGCPFHAALLVCAPASAVQRCSTEMYDLGKLDQESVRPIQSNVTAEVMESEALILFPPLLLCKKASTSEQHRLKH